MCGMIYERKGECEHLRGRFLMRRGDRGALAADTGLEV